MTSSPPSLFRTSARLARSRASRGVTSKTRAAPAGVLPGRMKARRGGSPASTWQAMSVAASPVPASRRLTGGQASAPLGTATQTGVSSRSCAPASTVMVARGSAASAGRRAKSTMADTVAMRDASLIRVALSTRGARRNRTTVIAGPVVILPAGAARRSEEGKGDSARRALQSPLPWWERVRVRGTPAAFAALHPHPVPLPSRKGENAITRGRRRQPTSRSHSVRWAFRNATGSSPLYWVSIIVKWRKSAAFSSGNSSSHG